MDFPGLCCAPTQTYNSEETERNGSDPIDASLQPYNACEKHTLLSVAVLTSRLTGLGGAKTDAIHFFILSARATGQEVEVIGETPEMRLVGVPLKSNSTTRGET